MTPDHQPCAVSLEEQGDRILREYEEATLGGVWTNVIPQAVREYFDRRIAERDRPPMHDPKLVEALADTLYHGGLGISGIVATGLARHLIETHRLVQLPEEPSGWVSPETAALIHNSDDGETVVIERHPDGNVPVYIIPGDPKEVEP